MKKRKKNLIKNTEKNEADDLSKEHTYTHARKTEWEKHTYKNTLNHTVTVSLLKVSY